jgi:rubrerythrin
MPQEFNHQEAIKIAVQSEKELMCFYQRAAAKTTHAEGRRVFEQLAIDEKEHINHFFRHYRGGDIGSIQEFMNAPCEWSETMIKEIDALVDAQVKDRRAMEIAMQKEQQLEQSLRFTARQIVDPGVRVIFDQMAKETRGHYEIIESEYARLMGMVHETDIDTFVRE